MTDSKTAESPSLKLQGVSAASHRGARAYQEDSHFSLTAAEGLCFGVFDGHGDAECARLCAERFPLIFVDLLKPNVHFAETLRQTIQTLNLETQSMWSGCTASVVFMPWTANEVHVAVLGDSPVIVKRANHSIWVAPEHNVRTNYAEAEAARARGGFVDEWYLYTTYGGVGLQMARALGDSDFSRVLSRVPDISSHVLGADSFVFVGTDGVLDPLHKKPEASLKALIAFIEAGADAQAIVNRALAIPTDDNATALLVRVD
jgi:serine/threonine protein phosphatase PrpC